MSEEPYEHRTLIVGPSWVGDMVMAQSLFKLLRTKHPDRPLDVLAPGASVSLVSRMPEVSLGIHLETGHGELNLSYRRGLGRRLKARNYQRAFVLPNSFKSALVPFFADIPVRTGFRGEFRYVLINDMRMLSESRLPRMVDRFVALGVGINDPLPEIQPPRLMVDEGNRVNCLDTFELRLDRPVLGLCPGAEYGDAKKWPEAHYAAVADYAVARGMQVWMFGSSGDADACRRIVEQATADTRPALVNLAGRTSLTDAVDLLSLCALIISNDSGLMHVACAVGCPVAVVYGSTSPSFTPPLAGDAEIVSDELPCSPCFKRNCPLGHKNCLTQLHASRLFPIVDRHLGSTPS